MICLCCSRTVMLLCNCSCMLGSCVWKPGERQASPTSCMPRFPLSRVNGADGREELPAPASLLLELRSSLRGRCRDVCGTSGDDGGSFFTMILGGCPARELLARLDALQCPYFTDWLTTVGRLSCHPEMAFAVPPHLQTRPAHSRQLKLVFSDPCWTRASVPTVPGHDT